MVSQLFGIDKWLGEPILTQIYVAMALIIVSNTTIPK